MTIEQTNQMNTLIGNANSCPKGIREDVYAQQVRKEAFRIVNGGKADKTTAKILNIPVTYDYAAKVIENACPRCGGAGKGNWGSVVGGVCYRCGGTGKR